MNAAVHDIFISFRNTKKKKKNKKKQAFGRSYKTGTSAHLRINHKTKKKENKKGGRSLYIGMLSS